MTKRKKPSKRAFAGMKLINLLNEWKDAGGSDIDVLLALDEYVDRAIEKKLQQSGKSSSYSE